MAPRTRSQAAKSEQKTPKMSTAKARKESSKPTRKTNPVKKATKNATRAAPAGKKAAAQKRKQANPPNGTAAKKSAIKRTKNQAKRSAASNIVELAMVRASPSVPEPPAPTPNFKLLELPFVVAKIVFGQMEFREQIHLSMFRRSRALLQKFPEKIFASLDSVGTTLDDEIFVKIGAQRIRLSNELLDNLMKQRVTSEKFCWHFEEEGSEKAFFKLLAAHKNLKSLHLFGDIDQDFYDTLIKTPQWKMIKEVKHVGDEKTIMIRAEDVSHLEKFSFNEIEQLSDETWKEILKDFVENKKTFKITTKRKLPYDEIDVWWRDSRHPFNIRKVTRFTYSVRVMDIPNDPDSVLVFGHNSHKMLGMVCRKQETVRQFSAYWRNQF